MADTDFYRISSSVVFRWPCKNKRQPIRLAILSITIDTEHSTKPSRTCELYILNLHIHNITNDKSSILIIHAQSTQQRAEWIWCDFTHSHNRSTRTICTLCTHAKYKHTIECRGTHARNRPRNSQHKHSATRMPTTNESRSNAPRKRVRGSVVCHIIHVRYAYLVLRQS